MSKIQKIKWLSSKRDILLIKAGKEPVNILKPIGRRLATCEISS